MSQKPQRVGTDDPEKIILRNIADFGWHAINVLEDDGHPPWTFTIGFYETWRFPELIILGRSRATAQHILNTVALGLEEVRSPDLKKTTCDLLPGSSCCFIEVAPHFYADYVGFARWYRQSGRNPRPSYPDVPPPRNRSRLTLQIPKHLRPILSPILLRQSPCLGRNRRRIQYARSRLHHLHTQRHTRRPLHFECCMNQVPRFDFIWINLTRLQLWSDLQHRLERAALCGLPRIGDSGWNVRWNIRAAPELALREVRLRLWQVHRSRS
jgi:hypothetical protein